MTAGTPEIKLIWVNGDLEVAPDVSDSDPRWLGALTDRELLIAGPPCIVVRGQPMELWLPLEPGAVQFHYEVQEALRGSPGYDKDWQMGIIVSKDRISFGMSSPEVEELEAEASSALGRLIGTEPRRFS